MTKQEHERLSPLLDKLVKKEYSAESAIIMGCAIFSPKTKDAIRTMDEIEKILEESKDDNDFKRKLEPYTVNAE